MKKIAQKLKWNPIRLADTGIQNPAPAANRQRLDWRRVMALYGYFSRNDRPKLPPEVIPTLENCQTPAEMAIIRTEALLVKRWEEMATNGQRN